MVVDQKDARMLVVVEKCRVQYFTLLCICLCLLALSLRRKLAQGCTTVGESSRPPLAKLYLRRTEPHACM